MVPLFLRFSSSSPAPAPAIALLLHLLHHGGEAMVSAEALSRDWVIVRESRAGTAKLKWIR
jgi:hypothetical protein